jgi:hypothetical protein
MPEPVNQDRRRFLGTAMSAATPPLAVAGTAGRVIRPQRLESRLAAGPVIGVLTITIASDFDGLAADGNPYRAKFTGKRSHRILRGIGHDVPQEAAGLCRSRDASWPELIHGRRNEDAHDVCRAGAGARS